VLARRRRIDRLTDRVTALLVTTAVLFGLAAAAELGRYLVLLRNRTRLIQPVLLLASDLSVYLTAGLALVVALPTAVALVGWLVRTRRTAYERAGRRDPRSLRLLLCGCLIPVVNLLWPGVLLIELARQQGSDPRTLRAVRFWWCAWVLNGAMVVAALCWRTAHTLQAQADGVIFTGYTDLVAVGVAALSLWLVRRCEGRDLRGRLQSPKRWVPAPGPVAPVIEPVHPIAEPADRADDPAVGNNDGAVASSAVASTAVPHAVARTP
jgi:hypothetical protein